MEAEETFGGLREKEITTVAEYLDTIMREQSEEEGPPITDPRGIAESLWDAGYVALLEHGNQWRELAVQWRELAVQWRELALRNKKPETRTNPVRTSTRGARVRQLHRFMTDRPRKWHLEDYDPRSAWIVGAWDRDENAVLVAAEFDRGSGWFVEVGTASVAYPVIVTAVRA